MSALFAGLLPAANAAAEIGPMLGAVPDGGPATFSSPHQQPRARLAPSLACPQSAPNPACNMTYHSGPVVHSHTTYVVYWEPAGNGGVSTNYHSLIERYLKDAAADSGRAANVYAVATQYYDNTGPGGSNNPLEYQQTFGGSFTDNTAFPATQSGCPLSDGTRTVSNCLTQTQESTELDNFIQTNSLPRGLNNLYFLVLPKGVETCSDDFRSCGNILNTTPNRYCAYHSFFSLNGHQQTIWANEPYIGIADRHCNSGSASSPNNDDADYAISPLSHEHNEIITDPTNGGWFDVDANGENGDKCNAGTTIYGPNIGSTASGGYNQIINHHPYEIQEEWSNAITGCAPNFGAVKPSAAFNSTPGSPHVNDSVSFDGSGSRSNDTGGYVIKYSWAFGDGGTDSSESLNGATPTTSHTYSSTGTFTVTLTVTDDAGMTDSLSHDVVVTTRPTTTTYTGPTNGDYNDPVTPSARLTDNGTSGGVANQTLTFTLGAETCAGTTDAAGNASCSVTPLDDPGPYTVAVSYDGNATYAASSDSKSFAITPEETTITYTGPKVVLAGASGATLTAKLVEDGSNDSDGDGGSPAPSPAETVTLSLGSQSCTSTTDSSGNVSCTIPSVTVPLGPETVGASFAGDAYYQPSNDSTTAIVFVFPSRGVFTPGDKTAASATPTTDVTWWSATWDQANALSGGAAPAAFKGFVDNVKLPTTTPAAPNACTPRWTTSSGNSPSPPASVPSYMGTLVTSRVTKSGSTIGGNTVHIVVVKTRNGYGPDPGHAGVGQIVATFC